MCTLSWAEAPDRTRHIFFNRDERKTRSRALPPQEIVKGVLAPIDADAAGSWLTVNSHGLCVALLNRWHESPPVVAVPKSRGELPLMLSASATVGEAAKCLKERELASYSPFTLVLLDAENEARYDWNGAALTESAPTQPITSSSYCFEQVRDARLQAFPAAKGDISSLAAFHDPPAPHSAYSVRMNRPDAQTWSRSHIIITPEQITFLYDEEFTDLAKPAQRHEARLFR